LERGDELPIRATGAVGVVEEVARTRVVDDAVISIVPASCARGGIEAHIAAAELARGADLRKGAGVERDLVPVRIEVEHRVGVLHPELGEGVGVLSAAAGYGIVARAALHPVVAAVGEDRVVPAEAE